MTTELVKQIQPKGNLQAQNLRDYEGLKARFDDIFLKGQKRIEREFMLIRYETGALINEHYRLNNDRADYGKQSLLKLEKKYGISHSELGRFAQFAQAYPISADRRKLKLNLPWSHYKKLITIRDEKRRWALTLQAEKENWSFPQVEDAVWREVSDDGRLKAPRLPYVSLGPFFLYKIIRLQSIHPLVGNGHDRSLLLVDFGFGCTFKTSLFRGPRLEAEDIVTAGKAPWSLERIQAANEESLYTFKACVEKVIDGDTLKLIFDLGSGCIRRETIRLNHIDCPELDTPEGKAAKKFVENELAGCDFITVKSIRVQKEKWGRYLGDVFYRRKKTDQLTYLNQLLLDEGHAVRKRY